MNNKNSCEEQVKVSAVTVAVVCAAIYWMATLPGCAGPLLLGIKSYTGSDGSRIDFITGADFTVGANGVDSVANARGIEPQKYGNRSRIQE